MIYQKLQNKDWLGRGENFVREADLMFDLRTSEPYSTYLYKIPPKGESLINPVVSKFVSALANKSLDIRFSPTQSYCDGKRIVISEEPKKLPSQIAVDVMIGLGVHEVAHLFYSTFKEHKDQVLRAIVNIVEDERIEDKLVLDFPGVFPFIQQAKKFYFDKLPDAPKNELEELFLAFLRLVRYPTAIPEALCDKFDVELSEIVDILTPYPQTYPDVEIASEKIYDLFKKYIQENENEEQNGEGEEGENGDGESSKGEKLTPEQVKEMLEKGLAKILEIVNEEKDEPTENSTVVIPTNGTGDVFAVRWEKPGGGEKPTADLNSIAAIRREFLPIDYKKKHTIHNRLSGNLDDSELARGYVGSKNVYEVTAKTKPDVINIGILIDQSGSMHGERIELARNVAQTIHEAVKGFSFVRFFAYGHSTYDSGSPTPTDIDVFSEFGKGDLNIRAKNACNRDGSAIMEVANRIQELSPYRTVLMMISDGQPNALVPHGFNNESFIRHAVKYARARNTKIAHISMVGIKPGMYDYEIDATNNFTQKMTLLLRKILRENFNPVTSTV